MKPIYIKNYVPNPYNLLIPRNTYKLIKILTFTLSFFILSACSEDFVDRYPSTSSVVENFYKTQENATDAVTAIYNMSLRDDWWSLYIFSEICSDECAGGAGTGDGGGFQRLDRGIQWPDHDANQVAWRTYYGGIYRANIYLENEGKIEWKGNTKLQLQYQAETRFLRAYYHFYLARAFGEIPALDHTLLPGEIPGRTPAENLYGFMLEDLKFAAENALSDNYDDMKPQNWGRVTKWAAEAMFARVYLFYSGYYNKTDVKGFTATDARNYIDDIINNSHHDLVNNYASLWMVPALSDSVAYAGEKNPEVLWSISANMTSGINWGGNLIQRMIGPRYTNADPYGQGWGAMTVLPTLWNSYETGDIRKTATILSWDDEGLTYSYIGQQQAQYTGYSCKKFELISKGGSIDSLMTNWQADGYEDLIIIRYADVLLMGAELYVVTGGDQAKALGYLNQVRSRAFGDNTHNYASATLDNIYKERKLELACEGIRYWDILRECKGDFSKLSTVLTYIDTTDDGDYSNSIDMNSLDVDGNNFVEKKGLFQIPQNEIDLMKGKIQQNPGYN